MADLYQVELPDGSVLDLKDKSAQIHVNDATSGMTNEPKLYKIGVTSQGHVREIDYVNTSDIEDLGFYTKEEVETLIEENKELPEVTEEDNDKVLTVVDGQWDKTNAPISLPEVTEEDNDKVLKVVEGEWSVAAESGGGSDLPQVTEEDNGKVLGVVDGVWDKTDPTSGTGVVELTKAEYDALPETKLSDGNLYFIKDYEESYAMNGKGMVSKVLWSGSIAAYRDASIEFADTLNNYDMILLETYSNAWFSAAYLVNKVLDGEWYITGVYDSNHNVGIINTTVSGCVAYNWQGNAVTFRIVGLKFCAATCCYSTDEQIVGQWIDGKPIYQKTWIFDSPLEVSNSTWTNTNIQLINGDSIINCFCLNIDKTYFPLMCGLLETKIIALSAPRHNDSVTCKTLTIQYTKTTD